MIKIGYDSSSSAIQRSNPSYIVREYTRRSSAKRGIARFLNRVSGGIARVTGDNGIDNINGAYRN